MMNTKDPWVKVVLTLVVVGIVIYILQHTQLLQTILGIAAVG
jgi:hypothetical protein